MPSKVLPIAFIAAAISGSANLGAAQALGTVTGNITDSASGAPIVGARVAIWCPNCYGRHPTDSTGHYQLNRLPVGTFKIEFHCPSHTLLGAEIIQRSVDVQAGREVVINVRVPPGRCVEPTYSERAGIFRGYWTAGFEASAFVPCADSATGVPAPLLPGKRVSPPDAWADLSHAIWPQHLVEREKAKVDEFGNPTHFVIWRGILKGPGSYGHMGVSDFLMIVDTVIAMKARGPADCRTHQFDAARGLTNVAADGRGQVVGLCMFRVESPAAELRR